MRHRMPKRALPLLLTICLLVSTWGVSTAFAAAEVGHTKTPLSAHWAGKTLGDWLAKGWIRADADGSVQPDRPILRGEMMAFANRAFGLTAKAEVAFSDLSRSDWEYDEVAIAVKAGYIQGYEDGTIRVRNQITRQEVAILIAGMLQLEANAALDSSGLGGETTYKDQAQIASWSDKAIAMMTAHKIIDGYEDGSFRPKDWVTRAEAIVMLDRARVRQGDQVYDKAGTFGPKQVTQTVNGNVTIKAGGVHLRNLIINGDIFIDGSVGNGQVTADGIEVTGTVFIRAGKVKLKGTISKLEADSSAVEIDIQSGLVKELLAAAKAAGSKVNVNQMARISRLVLDGSIQVTGQGEIQQAVIHKGAEESTFERKPNRKESPASSYAPSYSYGGGGGSGGSNPVINPDEQPITPENDEGIMNSNSSFEEVTGAEGARFWTPFLKNNSAGSSIKRSSEQAHSNSSSMKAIAVQSGGLYQNLHLQPGNYAMSTSYYVPANSSTEGTLQLFVQFMDDRGMWLSEAVSEVWPSQYDKGQWNTFHWTLQVPESVSGNEVKIAQIGVDLKGFNPNEIIYLDDLILRKSSKAPVSVQVASISAENGRMRAVLNEIPDNQPAIRDFKIIKRVTETDFGTSITIVPEHISWDETTRTVELTLPILDTAANEQRFMYRVAYKGKPLNDPVEVVIPADTTKPINKNPSFEGYMDGSWIRWFEPADNLASTKMERTNELAATGKYSFKASDVKHGAPYQNVSVAPGSYKLSVSYYTAAGTQTDGTINLTVNYRSSTSYIGTIDDVKHQVQETSGVWNTIEWTFEVPETLNGMSMDHIQISALLDGFAEGEVVFIDDFNLITLGSVPNVQISNLAAENGTIRAVLSTIPSDLPALGDFAVKQQVNADEEVVVVPTAIAWDESTRTVTLTIPQVDATATQQRVVYRVAYQGKPAIEGEAVVIPADLTKPYNRNPSFETSLDGTWYMFAEPASNFALTKMERSTEFTLTGEHSLKAAGVKFGAPYQNITLSPGNYKISASYYTPAGTQTEGTMNLTVNYRNSSNGYVGTVSDVKHQVKEASGEWHTITWPLDVPETYNGMVVEQIQLSVLLEGFSEDEVVFIDDVDLIKLAPQPVNQNPSFETSLDSTWYMFAEPASNFALTKMERSTEFALTGEYSLKATGVKFGAPYQNITLSPGMYKISASYYTPADTQTEGTMNLTVNYRNSNGYVGTVNDVKHQVKETSGAWHTITWLLEVPETYNGMVVEHIQLSALLEGFAEDEVVYLDNLIVQKDLDN
ncbi:S-layer homology domain-containing protein [Paenibacillus eucommiae]|uniref:SLH domain-containing protein n=1 Tax=Paenibacillus eucommiae TaxID=1355755 RepID=A0ABS4ILS9_9BACL|nr:S-layer homology domain-containing protein [Paenibacillus eucommiae]MBP1988524.1 hypothetical protein [Paenibacillus eucommiae]